MPDDDLHDLGLAFDLATLRSRALLPARIERRGALKLLAGAGAGLVLVACGSDSKTASTTTSTVGGATSTTAAGTSTSGTSVDAIPEETGGPYPGDGTNGPNVLVESGIVRQDIRSSFGSYSGIGRGRAADGRPHHRHGRHRRTTGRRRRVPLALRPGGRATRSTRAASPTRTTSAACRRPTTTGTSASPASSRARTPVAGPTCTSRCSATSPAPRAPAARWSPRSWRCPRTRATSSTPPPATSRASPTCPGRRLQSDMVFSDGYESQLATVTGTVEGGMTATLTVGV